VFKTTKEVSNHDGGFSWRDLRVEKDTTRTMTWVYVQVDIVDTGDPIAREREKKQQAELF